ncbi:MAG: adenylate/guanylate cyclase domain-containing protein [Anaerolineales bacterium]
MDRTRTGTNSTGLPSGTVAFLYTDIEGSTPLWEHDFEAMTEASDMHNLILHQTIGAHGGVVYKIIGDAFQAAFAVPAQAVAAAVAAQRGLAAASWGKTGPLRVRMGVHVGEAIAEENDYATTHTLNRVARIMAAGHGGQILISQAVAELVRGALPDEVSLRDLGDFRMKGLSQLEHLYQVVVPDLPQDFPPLASLDYRPNNLPIQVTAFVGRQKEVSQAQAMLSGCRLLTITGPGGVGKTRLALQVASEVIDEYPGGVWYVELAHLQDPSMVPLGVAKTIGMREQEGRPILDALADYLAKKEILLLLDNCEHLIDACAKFSDWVLRSAPEAKVLATSRQNLALSAEQVFPLGGMDIPEWEYPENLRRFSSVELFLQSAQRVSVGFEIQGDELNLAARICRLVQGMPLAILLAAAWVDTLTLEEIAGEISQSVDFLESELRDLPERHRSMRAAFEYSWNLLSEEERTAFARMAVFRGGFESQAARTITGASIRTLTKLIHKSLLQRDSQTGRFSLHEILRQLAEEHLAAAGEENAIREAHSSYYLAALAQFEPDLRGKRQLQALDQIEAKFENIRTAWSWAVKNRDADKVSSALESLFLFTSFRSHFAEGYELFRQARQQWPTSQASATALAGRLLVRYPDQEQAPEAVYQRGLEIARESGVPAEVAYALNQLGRYLAHSGSDYTRGMALLEDSLAMYREMGDNFAVARVLDDIAFGYSMSDQEMRISYGKESLELRRQTGDRIGEANVLRNLAVAAAWLGRFPEALQYAEPALGIAREMGDRNSIGWLVSILAETNFYLGNFGEGREQMEEALRISHEIGDRDLIRNCLLGKSILISIVDQDYEQAKQMMLEAHPPGILEPMLELQANFGYAVVDCGLGEYDECRRHLQGLFREMKRAQLRPNSFPLLTPLVAIVQFQRGDPESAAECLGLFESLPEELTIWGRKWELLNRLRDELESALGAENYQAALGRGESLEMEGIEGIMERWQTG